MCRYFNFRFFPSLKISTDYLLGILGPIHFPSLIKILHGTNYPRRIEDASMHRCSCLRAFKANAARASSPFVLGDRIGEQCHGPNRISGKKKEKRRRKEERLQKRGGRGGGVVNPRVSTSRFQSFPSLLGIEYSTDSNRLR